SAAGARYGHAVVWAAAIGALLKYVLNEGLARWQLATGTTLIEGWVERLGRWVQWCFLAYLVLWSFIVAGALISACGLAAHAIAPALSVATWGILHSLAAAAMVLAGGYGRFESVMKIFVGVMFASLVGCAALVSPPAVTIGRSIAEASIPAGGVAFVLGIIGGVGGSVTLLSYGYWMREKGWEGPARAGLARIDLSVAYLLTGLFGLAVIVLSASLPHHAESAPAGTAAALRLADLLGEVLGPAGTWAFRIGFWAAVSTSILGVWQGVPYIFCDFAGLMKRLGPEDRRRFVGTRSPWYRGYLLYLCIPPMALLWLHRPVAVIVAYAVAGALFMPFLAGTLLYMNGRADWVGPGLRNGWLTSALLVLCLLLFGYLGFTELARALFPTIS
ncbi:MAG TPA: Nramp family divalent metal transporter, partial [Candidatus Saccharimonadales bacterium]|nr:Nramp family divalent metal transporter [Candidatus Saccharimonadales bacterium]